MIAWAIWAGLVLLTAAVIIGPVFLLTLPARRRNREMWAETLADIQRPGNKDIRHRAIKADSP